jgi:hypothetical protein
MSTRQYTAYEVVESPDSTEGVIEIYPDIITEIEQLKRDVEELKQNGGSGNVDLSGYVPETRKVAGVDLADDITVEELQDGLSVYPIVELSREPKFAPEQELELKGKVGQIGIYVSPNTTTIDFYRCKSVTKHPQYGNTFIYEWEHIGSNSNSEYYPFSSGSNHSFGKHRGNMAFYDGSKTLIIWTGFDYYKMLIETDIVTAIDENSTDTQIPSAKAVKYYVDNLFTAYDNSILSILGGDENV